MEIFETITSLQSAIKEKKSLGFVPTMGALHKGHLSLIEKSKAENEITVVSIFVNPTQFNNPDDLKNYPRTLESDASKLQSSGVDFIFAPSVKEIYPETEEENMNYDFGDLDKVMEGKHRPGHFKGVAQVVSKLFKIVDPHKSYFGEKDFQQLVIIRELVKKMNSAIQIIGCPTIREEDGLAMSSRNQLLTADERKEAPKISRELFYIRDNWQQFSVKEILQHAIHAIEESGTMKVEYLEIGNEKNLAKVNEWHEISLLRVFTAVKTGKVRLIDNVPIYTSLSF